MRKILLFVAALMTAMCAMAQEKFYVYMNDGTTKEYAVAECDSLSFVAPPAPATTGEAKTKDGTLVKWVQLWENGPKFAEYNVGATTATGESSYGGYYAWGGSQDKVDDHYRGTEPLLGVSDTATQLWGSNWQMPTKADFEALLANCDVEWKSETDGYGVAGNLYIGKGDYSGNSVFFPAAGYYNSRVKDAGSDGYYWSSTPSGSIYAYFLTFYSSDQDMIDDSRSDGQPVRAILNERK